MANESNNESHNNDDFMLTTFDNAFNPFTHFKEWLAYDESKGYKTCQWLDRCCMTSSRLDDNELNSDVSLGVADFLELNPFGMHYKVYKSEADTLIPLMYNTYCEQKEKLLSETS